MKNLKTFRQVLENASYTDSAKKFSELIDGDKLYLYEWKNGEFDSSYEVVFDEIKREKDGMYQIACIGFSADNLSKEQIEMSYYAHKIVSNHGIYINLVSTIQYDKENLETLLKLSLEYIEKFQNIQESVDFRLGCEGAKDDRRWNSVCNVLSQLTSEDEWFDDTDNFLDIFDDENDTITPEYYLDDSGSDRYWINPAYKGKAINKKDITCKFAETEERGRDIVITKLVNNNGDVILYNISED